jgi:hypothetical protein
MNPPPAKASAAFVISAAWSGQIAAAAGAIQSTIPIAVVFQWRIRL